MKHTAFTKILACTLCFLLLFEQSGFAQIAGQLDIGLHLSALRGALIQEKFRPLHLRSLSYDAQANNFKLLLEKGDNPRNLEEEAKQLLGYFFIGIALPNESFWVNLRPDSPDAIVDPLLAQTDIGRILLEADLQLKKDTASATDPRTLEGKQYWDKLYAKARELFGYDNVTVPTLTRPWIVPGEIIIRETAQSAYIYKATLKVMLEQDCLKESALYKLDDPRMKIVNEYSSQLIRQLVLPKITKDVNTAKRYAALRQVYHSLILAHWFKRGACADTIYAHRINGKDLAGLTSAAAWSKDGYFKAYQKLFKDGQYNLQEPVQTPYGQTVRSYFSGGIQLLNAEVMASATVQGLRFEAPTGAPEGATGLIACTVDGQGAARIENNSLGQDVTAPVSSPVATAGAPVFEAHAQVRRILHQARPEAKMKAFAENIFALDSQGRQEFIALLQGQAAALPQELRDLLEAEASVAQGSFDKAMMLYRRLLLDAENSLLRMRREAWASYKMGKSPEGSLKDMQEALEGMRARYDELLAKHGPPNIKTTVLSWHGRQEALHQALVPVLRQMRQEKGPDEELVVVDFGVGRDAAGDPAPATFDLAGALQASGLRRIRLIGVDQDLAIIQDARRKAASQGPSWGNGMTVEFMASGAQGGFDMRRLGIIGADMIIASNVIMHYPFAQQAAARGALCRSINAKGRLVVSEGPMPEGSMVKYALYAQDGSTVMEGRLIAPPRAGKDTGNAMATSLSGVFSLLGFNQVDPLILALCIGAQLVAPLAASLMLGTAQGNGKKIVSAQRRTQIIDALESKNWYFLTSDEQDKSSLRERIFEGLYEDAPGHIERLMRQQLKIRGIDSSAVSVESILVYGSWCYSLHARPSDIDIAVVVKGLNQNVHIEGVPIPAPETWFRDASRKVRMCDLMIISEAAVAAPVKGRAQQVLEARMWGDGVTIYGNDMFMARPSDETLAAVAQDLLQGAWLHSVDLQNRRARIRDNNFSKIARRWDEIKRIISVIGEQKVSAAASAEAWAAWRLIIEQALHSGNMLSMRNALTSFEGVILAPLARTLAVASQGTVRDSQALRDQNGDDEGQGYAQWTNALLRQTGIIDIEIGPTDLGFYSPTPEESFRELNEIISADAPRDGLFIDAGSGRGLFALNVARAHPGMRVVGIEFDELLYNDSMKLLEVAKAQDASFKGRVHFLRGDYNDPKNSEFVRYFQAADVAYYYNWGTKDVDALARTLKRNIKVGARVVFLHRPDDVALKKLVSSRDFASTSLASGITIFERKNKASGVAPGPSSFLAAMPFLSLDVLGSFTHADPLIPLTLIGGQLALPLLAWLILWRAWHESGKGKTPAAAAPAVSQAAPSAPQGPGGIDFRALPAVIQPAATLQLQGQPPLTNVPIAMTGTVSPSGKELLEIQRMMQRGIIPSSERIKSVLMSCCAQDDAQAQMKLVLRCIADIMRMEEERCCPTESSLKDMLVLLESGKTTQDLQAALRGINVEEQAPRMELDNG